MPEAHSLTLLKPWLSRDMLHSDWRSFAGGLGHAQTSLRGGWLQFWEEQVWVGSQDCEISDAEDLSRAASLLR